jgi:hypothetical protein
MNLNFKVNTLERMVDIDTFENNKENSFSYSNMLGMYKTKSTQGHGIQVNNSKLEQPFLKMCDKIANAIYDFQKEIKNG